MSVMYVYLDADEAAAQLAAGKALPVRDRIGAERVVTISAAKTAAEITALTGFWDRVQTRLDNTVIRRESNMSGMDFQKAQMAVIASFMKDYQTERDQILAQHRTGEREGEDGNEEKDDGDGK